MTVGVSYGGSDLVDQLLRTRPIDNHTALSSSLEAFLKDGWITHTDHTCWCSTSPRVKSRVELFDIGALTYATLHLPRLLEDGGEGACSLRFKWGREKAVLWPALTIT
jgi:hypothetical protein